MHLFDMLYICIYSIDKSFITNIRALVIKLVQLDVTTPYNHPTVTSVITNVIKFHSIGYKLQNTKAIGFV